jgi:hypothetical protein
VAIMEKGNEKNKARFKDQHFVVKNTIVFKWAFFMVTAALALMGRVEVEPVMYCNVVIFYGVRAPDVLLKSFKYFTGKKKGAGGKE